MSLRHGGVVLSRGVCWWGVFLCATSKPWGWGVCGLCWG
ncbi:hypothetical protein SEA_OCTOBIEN14_148 [Gordonia phage Octobien14]|uniref:Uncharacterized protein n=1 Tax=Gordonia phage Octobien14 TaxID=2483673 RepID=A0A3G3MA02_9CAUD|nr:hypothetical protein L3Y22_gp096 [Gordonia phage Octobien14]AYR03291.1 hypothetical protein SEA_OCTOBIEN14_148 [Gordonia phage Octobien14]